VSAEPAATADGPARRRDSWSLKTIVEDVSGRPIDDFQDPARPVHPYLKVKGDPGPLPARHEPSLPRTADLPSPLTEEDLAVERVYPPLAGATGRGLHGPQAEHHHETLAPFDRSEETPPRGFGNYGPRPARRPERIYLHYLLMHVDRLSDSALNYLLTAAEEERARRRASLRGSPPAGP